MRKIEVPTDSDKATDIQWRRQKRKAREREEAQPQPRGRRQGGQRYEQMNHTRKRRELQKKGPGQRQVTWEQRLEERRDDHSHDTRRGT